ncbi:MAG: serine/threonine protein kinase [Spirirestis rafaelensis WJT71-NPBG6]|jgi:serine/threonine protein kinase|nr:serine/threonine protein kinase [Spirirestis rafaelensis WJT71-NPBG6]
MSDPNIDRLLGKRYHLQELIGTGAMGRVYRAKDILLGGVSVAVKFLALSIENEKMRLQDRFQQEAKTCALVGQKSIHIVRVMDYGVDENNTPFYVMEYLQGKNLSHVIRKQQMTLPSFLNITRQICLGLQCAHDGILVDGKVCPIIHRDIKPSNILVITDPSFGELVKIVDFGIAKLLLPDSNHTNYYLGTLAYSSPEQMEGKELDTSTKTLTPPASLELKTKVDSHPSFSDELARVTSWPPNKPIADIVFPQSIHVNGNICPALWVMLPKQEIQNRLICTRYNQFLFITSPHPMLLWLTVIYNRKHGAKWLPYYLDLKTSAGKEITRLLGDTGHYRLLFFAREAPHSCAHIQLSTIAPTQRQRLQQWVTISSTLVSSADPQVSKNLLKNEYEKIKPQILAKLEVIDTDSPFYLSNQVSI